MRMPIPHAYAHADDMRDPTRAFLHFGVCGGKQNVGSKSKYRHVLVQCSAVLDGAASFAFPAEHALNQLCVSHRRLHVQLTRADMLVPLWSLPTFFVQGGSHKKMSQGTQKSGRLYIYL